MNASVKPVGRDRPIIFSAPMVRAILVGRKTQTRRIIKPVDSLGAGWPMYPAYINGRRTGDTSDPNFADLTTENGGVPLYAGSTTHCPGDRLWVRETWCPDAEARDETLYRADGVHVVLDDGDGFTATNKDGSERSPWRSPIHMPRARSRLTLEVTEIRVERLASISREDAIAEGATSRPHCYGCHRRDDGWSMDWSPVGQPSRWSGRTLTESDIALWSPQEAFGAFINELHDPRWNYKGDGIFGANPWVAAISFRRVQADAVSSPAAEGERA